MDEVEERAVGDVLQKRGLPHEPAAIPAHVRHLELVRHVEADHLPAQNAQTLELAPFVAHVEQQLQAQADAQKRLARGDRVADRPDQVAAAQFGDRVPKRAHARQHDLIGRGQLGRAGRDRRRMAHLLEALLDAAQVAHLVVDDGDLVMAVSSVSGHFGDSAPLTPIYQETQSARYGTSAHGLKQARPTGLQPVTTGSTVRQKAAASSAFSTGTHAF